MTKRTTRITESSRWTGKEHEPAWVCEFCANSYPTPNLLRAHIGLKHPDVVIVEDETE